MKLDLQSLSTEPLVYMLMHSGAFVTALGIIFFLIGLLFGRVTWGRYKGQSRELRAEAEAMKEEMANLKRKLGELSVKPGPAMSMVTEMIVLPRKESPAPAAAAAVAPEPKKSADVSVKPAPGSASTPEPSTPPQSDVVRTKAPLQPEPDSNGASTTPGTAWVPVLASAAASTPVPTPPDPAPTPDPLASPLAAIIAPAPAPKKEPHTSLEKDILVLPEIPSSGSPRPPAAPPPVKSDFDFDFQLGLIYKSKPEHSDDLTALKGVASTLEQRLHTLGVYTYEQVASWTPDQVREFSTRLSFKDRIEREQWVEQARELLAGRHQRQKQPA